MKSYVWRRYYEIKSRNLISSVAIAAMREAVGGVVWEIYLPNLIILLGFFGVFLLLGLFVKPLIASKVERFESKFSESELGEH